MWRIRGRRAIQGLCWARGGGSRGFTARIAKMQPAVGVCDVCGKRGDPHGHYLVKIEVYADPSMPGVTAEELDECDLGEELKDLMEQMQGMNAEELMDQVHRRFEFKLCRRCQREFLANPLGLPRGNAPTGEN